MKVIDPHIHLWDTRQVSYPWLATPSAVFSGDNRLLPQPYGVSEFLRDADGIEVLMTVDVEANPADPLAEAGWLQALADHPANSGHPHGIVAYAASRRTREGGRPRPLQGLGGSGCVSGGQTLSVDCTPTA